VPVPEIGPQCVDGSPTLHVQFDPGSTPEASTAATSVAMEGVVTATGAVGTAATGGVGKAATGVVATEAGVTAAVGTVGEVGAVVPADLIESAWTTGAETSVRVCRTAGRPPWCDEDMTAMAETDPTASVVTRANTIQRWERVGALLVSTMC
jgi:hypothetical protein